jgi:hypothetical protein
VVQLTDIEVTLKLEGGGARGDYDEGGNCHSDQVPGIKAYDAVGPAGALPDLPLLTPIARSDNVIVSSHSSVVLRFSFFSPVTAAFFRALGLLQLPRGCAEKVRARLSCRLQMKFAGHWHPNAPMVSLWLVRLTVVCGRDRKTEDRTSVTIFTIFTHRPSLLVDASLLSAPSPRFPFDAGVVRIATPGPQPPPLSVESWVACTD